MWFDPYKLLANANFQFEDTGGLDVTTAADPSGSIVAGAPVNTTGPTVPSVATGAAPADALSPASAPADLGVANTMFGTFDPATMGAGDAPDSTFTATAPISDPTSTTSTGPAAFQGQGGKTAGPSDPTAGDTPTPLRAGNVQGQADLGQTGAAAGAGGANAGVNAMQNLARALQGVSQAAQGGNPQAQQLMNMLRQMQQMGMMNSMMGGQGYNPYMNQQFNPWLARQRMEQMRREFMERQRLRQQLYGAGAGRPGVPGRPGGTFGGGRGRAR